MAVETIRIEPNESIDSIIQRLKRVGSTEILLILPEQAKGLQTLDQFNVLRREVRDADLNVTFMGGNKTTRGLAKILGFSIREGVADDVNVSSDQHAEVRSFANLADDWTGTIRVEPTESLDSVIQRLKLSNSKDIVLIVPENAKTLQTLHQFNLLRSEVLVAHLNITFMGGNKTTRGLAKIYGFSIREAVGPDTISNPALPAQPSKDSSFFKNWFKKK
jgi:hypothetical protein